MKPCRANVILVMSTLALVACVFGQAPDIFGLPLRSSSQQQPALNADTTAPIIDWNAAVEAAEERAKEAEQAHEEAKQSLSEATSNRDAQAQQEAQDATAGAAF